MNMTALLNRFRRMTRLLLACALSGLLMGFNGSATAQSTEQRTLARATELRTDSFSDSAVLANLLPGLKLEVIKTQGVWAQVRANGALGWVRFSALESSGARVSSVSQLDTGRMAGNNVLATSGIRSLRASRHALIVGVGDYANTAITSLSGVTHDIESAKKMAADMGIPDANMTILRDKNATLSAIKRALEDLNTRVQDGDRVFFYFWATAPAGLMPASMINPAQKRSCPLTASH